MFEFILAGDANAMNAEDHLIFILEHLDLLDHLFDLEAEEAEEGELG